MVLISIAIAVSGIGPAATANADPNAFSSLSCSCPWSPDVGSAGPDQIALGIRDGLAYPQGTHQPSKTNS